MKKIISNVILVILVVAVALCISNVCYATSDVNDLIQNLTVINSENAVNENTTENENNTVQNINTVANINTTNTNTTTNTTLPQTGANDTMMWIIIGVCAVAAVYTYKKVRDYNV